MAVPLAVPGGWAHRVWKAFTLWAQVVLSSNNGQGYGMCAHTKIVAQKPCTAMVVVSCNRS